MTVEERWFRWDKLINSGDYNIVVDEFDLMIKKRERIVFGDLIRRDDALELMGVISLSPNAMFKRKEEKNEFKTRR